MVLLATNASSECSFSAMSCVTSYLRSTMSQGQLSHLTMLSVHKDLTDQLNLVHVAILFLVVKAVFVLSVIFDAFVVFLRGMCPVSLGCPV